MQEKLKEQEGKRLEDQAKTEKVAEELKKGQEDPKSSFFELMGVAKSLVPSHPAIALSVLQMLGHQLSSAETIRAASQALQQEANLSRQQPFATMTVEVGDGVEVSFVPDDDPQPLDVIMAESRSRPGSFGQAQLSSSSEALFPPASMGFTPSGPPLGVAQVSRLLLSGLPSPPSQPGQAVPPAPPEEW